MFYVSSCFCLTSFFETAQNSMKIGSQRSFQLIMNALRKCTNVQDTQIAGLACLRNLTIVGNVSYAVSSRPFVLMHMCFSIYCQSCSHFNLPFITSLTTMKIFDRAEPRLHIERRKRIGRCI